MKRFTSHGTGEFRVTDFKRIGTNVILEPGVLVFHPETIEIGDNVYVGHRAILKGYHTGSMSIGSNVWIGQDSFLHAAGGIMIKDNVGIGPKVSVLTSTHEDQGMQTPLLFSDLAFAPVTIEEDCDIGIAATILPGVTVGRGCQVGAGAVVTKDLPPYAVAAGVPAKVIRSRA
ncbi:MAG: acyltransferase [Methanobacteriota archaeon]